MPSYQSPTIIEPGDYDAEITHATEKTSKGGNAMIELTVLIPSERATVKDFLVFAPSMAWKLDQFAAALGRTVNPGDEVTIECEECEGVKARVTLAIEEGKPKSPGSKEKFDDKNKITKWHKADGDAAPAVPTTRPTESRSPLPPRPKPDTDLGDESVPF